MPSDAKLQNPGGDDETFVVDTGTNFKQSAYSNVLDRGRANIRTPVMPHAERHAQPEASHKQSPESTAKHKHQHSKTKRVCRHSPTKSKAPTASQPKSPEATTPPPARCTPPAEQVPSRSTHRRKAAERADASAVQLARNAPRLTGVMRVRPSVLGPAPVCTKLFRPHYSVAVSTFSIHRASHLSSAT